MNNIFRISIILLTWALFIVPSFMAAGEPVIAVAADGDTADVAVSQQAARAAYFLLFDAQGVLVEAVANPYKQAKGGAGPQAVAFLATKGVRTVIAGEFGSRMSAALQAKGMAFRTASGIAADAVRQLGQK